MDNQDTGNRLSSPCDDDDDQHESAWQVHSNPPPSTGDSETLRSLESEKSWNPKQQYSSAGDPTAGPHSVVEVSAESRTRERPWKVTFFRFAPLSGLACLVLTIGGLVASLGILVGSDGQPATVWTATPGTYLAIFTAIGNLAIRYAAIQGVLITWWLRASKGSTLSKLHWDFRSGTTLRGALTAGRHMGLLGLACICSTMVVVDGPLLQRASKIVSAPVVDKFVPLNVAMAQELPAGLGGTWVKAGTLGVPDLGFSKAFNKTIPTNDESNPQENIPNLSPFIVPASGQWKMNAPLKEVIQGCPINTTCEVQLRAPVLWPTVCTSHRVPVSIWSVKDLAPVSNNRYAPPMDSLGFLVDISLIIEDVEKMNLITGYATGCDGVFDYKICTLESAIGEYTVQVNDESIDFDRIGTPSLVAFANNTAVTHKKAESGAFYSTLAAYVAEVQMSQTCSLAYYREDNDTDCPPSSWITCQNSAWEPHLRPVGVSTEQCPLMRDPHADTIKALNRYMIYAGAFLATDPRLTTDLDSPSVESRLDPGRPIHYDVTGEVKGDQAVFSTHYLWFMGALIVQVVCIALILPTYWGWWKIGREVSFSPLEMAKAFEAPMLADLNSNSSGRDLAKASEHVEVRYGVLAGARNKIAFGSPGLVRDPENGARFDV